jgi:CheY-like chemotaxis protein
MRRLFKSFSQVDGSSTRRYGGTGLGLAISKSLVEMMDGEIGAESTPGRGSRFWFTARLARSARALAARPGAGPVPAVQEAAARDLLPSGRSISILLAEDNVINQKVACRVLEKLGHRVAIANNGQEALQALAHHTYDLVLMDLQMPILDGLKATRMIREETVKTTNPRIPIIAMTAHAMKDVRQQCLDAGMDDYVTKPVRPQELRAALDLQLARPDLDGWASDSEVA